MYQGHRGWVFCMEVYNDRLFTGGDDRTIIIWDIETCKILETLNGHENGVTSIGFAYNDLFSGSFDHNVICWDLHEIEERIEEKQDMRNADVEARRQEVYANLMGVKKGKKKGGAKKGGAKKGKK